MIRIFYIDAGIGEVGGSFVSLYHLIHGLDKSKYTPICAFYSENKYTRMLEHEGVEIIQLRPRHARTDSVKRKVSQYIRPNSMKRIRNSKLYAHYLNTIYFFATTIPSSLTLYRILRRKNIDWVHANSGLVHNRDAIIASILRRVPCICHIRTSSEQTISITDKILSRFVAKFICISKAVKNGYEKQAINPRKMSVVYNGVDLRHFNPKMVSNTFLNEFNLENDSVAILGRIIDWKGHRYFLEAAQLVLRTRPSVIFFIVGEGPDEASLKEQAQSLGIAKSIRFTGPRGDIPDLLNSMTVIVNPATSDSFSRTMLEAMAMQTCVIASDTGGIRELIVHNKNGILVPPKNPRILAEKILTLLDDAALRHRLRSSARKTIEETFDIRYNVAQIETVYESILDPDHR
jgi:glycosyltransferase involved in cell wall biosynthesis